MSFADVLSAIESPGYGGVLGVVSTPRAFDRAVQSSEEVTDLKRLCLTPEYRSQLVERLFELYGQGPDPGFAHPRDIPIAIYLRVLEDADPDVAIRAAKDIAGDPALWWSRAVAKDVLAMAPSRAGQATFRIAMHDVQVFDFDIGSASSSTWTKESHTVAGPTSGSVQDPTSDASAPTDYLMLLFDQQPTPRARQTQ